MGSESSGQCLGMANVSLPEEQGHLKKSKRRCYDSDKGENRGKLFTSGKRVRAFKLWSRRRVLRISWTEHSKIIGVVVKEACTSNQLDRT